MLFLLQAHASGSTLVRQSSCVRSFLLEQTRFFHLLPVLVTPLFLSPPELCYYENALGIIAFDRLGAVVSADRLLRPGIDLGRI